MGPHDTIKKVLKHKCLKFPHIVHLNLNCISYEQKKGQESNWEFDFRPQIPWKQGSNKVQLECVIHHWKDIYKGYKILSSYFQNTFNLRKIWMSKILGLPLRSLEEKWHLDVIPMERHKVDYREENGASSRKLQAM